MANLSLINLVKYIVATPSVKRDRLNLRLWFGVFCIYMIALAGVSLWAFGQYAETQSSVYRVVWLFGLYMFWFSLASTFMPLPTSWFVLFLASPVGGLGIAPLPRVLIVAALGAMATAVSHLNEYHLISFMLRLGKIHRVRQTRIYAWAETKFQLSPFMLQTVFNIIPIPADPVRWLAIMSAYPLPRFFAAHWLGRFVRYGLMAFAATILKLTILQIAIIQIVLVVVVLIRLMWQHVRNQDRHAEPMEEPAQ